MKSSLVPGVTVVNRVVVDKAKTIGFMGEEGRVYATPYLIGDIEMTCRNLILAHADANEDSVGMEVAVRASRPDAPRHDRRDHRRSHRRRGPQGHVRGDRQG